MVSAKKALVLIASLPVTLACLGYEGGVPTATGTTTSSKVIEVKAGQVYDGLWRRYDRGSGACTDQAEGGNTIRPYKLHLCTKTDIGDADAVFLLRSGATLKNAM